VFSEENFCHVTSTTPFGYAQDELSHHYFSVIERSRNDRKWYLIKSTLLWSRELTYL